jgi:hypothetical protein
MDGIDRFVWIMFIGITLINGAIYWHQAMSRIGDDQEMRERFTRFFKGFMIAMLAPWVAMAIASIIGGVGAADLLSRPRTNPFVLLFDATLFAVWIVTVISIYFGDGAEMLSYTYGRGGLQAAMYSPFMIKIWVAFMLLGGIAGYAMIFSGRFGAMNLPR